MNGDSGTAVTLSGEAERVVAGIHSLRLGSGRPLVMLHGWAHSIQNLRPAGELLAWEREVHLLDLPGHGKTPPPPSVWGTEEYARAVLRYLDERQLADVDLLGHSFGGRVSIRLASAFPDRVRSLILLNSHGVRYPLPFKRRVRAQGLTALRRVLRTVDAMCGTDLYVTKYIPRFASRDYKSAGPMRETFVRLVNEDLTSELGKICAQTMLLWGERDTETPLAIARILAENIHGSKLVVLPGRGHEPFNGGGAHLCAYHVREFLRGVDGGRS